MGHAHQFGNAIEQQNDLQCQIVHAEAHRACHLQTDGIFSFIPKRLQPLARIIYKLIALVRGEEIFNTRDPRIDTDRLHSRRSHGRFKIDAFRQLGPNVRR